MNEDDDSALLAEEEANCALVRKKERGREVKDNGLLPLVLLSFQTDGPPTICSNSVQQ